MTDEERKRLEKVEAEVERLKHKDDEGFEVVPHRGKHSIARNKQQGYLGGTIIEDA